MNVFIPDGVLSDHFKFAIKPIAKPASKPQNLLTEAHVFILGNFDEKKIQSLVKTFAPEWQKPALLKKTKEVTHFAGSAGPIWIVARKKVTPSSVSLSESDQAWYRDQVGSLLGYFKSYEVSKVYFEMIKMNTAQELGSLLGLNLAAYQYKAALTKTYLQEFPEIYFSKTINKKILTEARAIALGMNAARHLVNTPPNLMNPKSMAEIVKKYFIGKKNIKVDIWDEKRLQKENMGLHLGVGLGSATPPCLIHIHYQSKLKSKKKNIAIVGKGITFDSGGLDIKPSAAMRLMKKDMAGSAAALGIAIWAQERGHERSLDIYMPMAENSVDSNSLRPSDVLIARNGMKVEIHNTDAEGRLVLADALSVAIESGPELVMNFATLTGSCRIALGVEIAGLFSNNDKLAKEMSEAGVRAGDLNWRLPLYQKYASLMNSSFADCVSATDGFAGAITAALFLEKFVGATPWIHLDMYAWNEKPTGCLSFVGGNAQPMQAVVEFLKAKS